MAYIFDHNVIGSMCVIPRFSYASNSGTRKYGNFLAAEDAWHMQLSGTLRLLPFLIS